MTEEVYIDKHFNFYEHPCNINFAVMKTKNENM